MKKANLASGVNQAEAMWAWRVPVFSNSAVLDISPSSDI